MSLSTNPLVKYVLGVWLIPIGITVITFGFTSDPNQPKSSHPSVTFTPVKIEIREGRGRNNTDHFELWLHHPDGRAYFHRDPEPHPITELKARIPENVPLRIIFKNENVLLGIERTDSTEPILSYEEIMAGSAHKRRVILSMAGIWLVVGNLFTWVICRMRRSRDEQPADI